MWSTTALLVLLSLGVSTIIAADLSSDAEAQKFLDRVTRSISSKDPAVIAGLFHPGFVFTGCKGVYNKEKVVAMLSHLPAGAKFNSTLKSSEYVKEDQIKYTVEVTGFGEKPLVAEFFLGRGDQQLFGGSIPSCSKTRSVRDDAKATVEKFLARITRSIESKDLSIISGLFQPGFVFKGCKGSYDKTKIVGMLMQTPAGTKMDFTLKSAEDQGESIKYLVSFAGPNKADIVAEFILNKKDQQLESGSIPSCQKRRLARAADSNSDAEAQKFLDRVTRSISSKDPAVIAGLFHPGFVFTGCKGVYNKEKVVAMLSHLPAGTKFNSTLKSSEFVKEDQIKYTVEVTGFGEKPLVAEFFLGRGDQQLLGGSIPSCQKKRLTRGAYVPTAMEHVEAFMRNAKAVIRRYDSGAVAKLFDEGFTVLGCAGKYDKAASVAQIGRIDTENPFDYELLSANFVPGNSGLVEFTVKIYGIWDNFTAEFLYHIEKGNLISGHYTSCKKEKSSRSSREFARGLY
ncbi:unnamed protein product [Caenorhabditis brenneri]